MRVGEILLAQETRAGVSAADKSILLSRARFLALSAMDLKFRVYQRMRWQAEARQVAAYLLEQRYLYADPAKLLSVMARADAEGGGSRRPWGCPAGPCRRRARRRSLRRSVWRETP